MSHDARVKAMKLRPIEKHLASLRRGRAPGQLIIQLTDHCNGRCPQCAMRATESFPRSRLGADEVRRILDAAARRGIEIVSFTGGEPLLFVEDLAALMNHAGSLGMKYIRTGTNGFLFANPHRTRFRSSVEALAATLSATPLRNFWISIDSAIPSVHEEMRGHPDVIKGIEEALPIFHAHGIYPSANLGINRNLAGSETSLLSRTSYRSDARYLEEFYSAFKKGFGRFFNFLVDLGFTIVSVCYPMSIPEGDSQLRAVYGATSSDSLIRFSPAEKVQLFRALGETIARFRPHIRVFSPRSSLYAIEKQHAGDVSNAYPCRGGIDFFFIDARGGNTFPCGYRGGENLGKFYDLNGDEPPASNGQEGCFGCDWECFRDPSELFGPFLQGLRAPRRLLNKFRSDSRYFKLWLGDLRYYAACDMFDGRVAPDYGRLLDYLV